MTIFTAYQAKPIQIVPIKYAAKPANRAHMNPSSTQIPITHINAVKTILPAAIRLITLTIDSVESDIKLPKSTIALLKRDHNDSLYRLLLEDDVYEDVEFLGISMTG